MGRILITGAGGMLGQDLITVLGDHRLTALTRAELDVTDPAAVDETVAGHDVVINAAAYTAVDAAETDEERALAVNATGPRLLAEAAERHGASLIQVSTDYVFPGTATTPYAESAPRGPVSAYGRTKAAGEEQALAAHPDGTAVVRTAWLYGAGGPNFARTMLTLARSRDTVQVVDDQLGQPTWTRDLAEQISRLVDAGVPAGIYHGTNAGQTSWYGFARAVFELSGLDPERVQPTDSTAFVRPAPRPAYSVLGHDAWARVGIAAPRDWREALEEAVAVGAVAPPAGADA
ncbi:dTDP-4-dehydrorhamnose reductase [Mycetocola reblochoni]|uniref:dTDP-4-dehydrorhamnose reductase n=2 Tax=Mycetocola reblochoni TaxID=331618 RepID=A0A1R4K153_9MICO|nr:dTDP-4-dehydrorhamnose reductase [Mycetocola reblochoni]RLP70482.1 dTDP-4-dehydrorhamnose reductase [Mycetocola reblochoni]SJN37763.1 dTDP-4-dehydrorhamnose reductase [Mycetocola reblochoni REB411]